MSAIKNQASTIYAEGLNNAGQAICETKDDASKLGRQVLHTPDSQAQPVMISLLICVCKSQQQL